MNIAELKYTIKKLSAEYLAEFIAIRRHFHQHPELSMEEMETAAYIAHKLDEYHIPYQKGIAQTGIIATIEGKNPSLKTIALRADMDALPITEINKTEYVSAKPGVMHGIV
jgi:Metal-dependent amidase/aminoacylase/carboxypeptidase